MPALAIEIQSRHLKDEMAFERSFFIELIKRLNVEPLNEHYAELFFLNEAYSDDEPEYSEKNLIWRNPGYVKKG